MAAKKNPKRKIVKMVNEELASIKKNRSEVKAKLRVCNWDNDTVCDECKKIEAYEGPKDYVITTSDAKSVSWDCLFDYEDLSTEWCVYEVYFSNGADMRMPLCYVSSEIEAVHNTELWREMDPEGVYGYYPCFGQKLITPGIAEPVRKSWFKKFCDWFFEV